MCAFDHCRTVTKVSNIKVEENKRKAVFSNPASASYDVFRVDGCVITEGERCDFLVRKEKTHSALVELKGADIEKAVDQLEKSLNHANVKSLLRGSLTAVAVVSKVRVPNADFYLLKTKKRFLSQYKCTFHAKCDKVQCDIGNLV